MELMIYLLITVSTLTIFTTITEACPSLCTCSDSRLNCYGKDLTEIPEDIPKDTVYIDLQTNNIKSVDYQLQNLSAVREVMLRFNQISHLSEGAFSNLPSLTHLNLGSNLITTISTNVFQQVPKLNILDLTDNRLTSVEGAFNNVPTLTKLVLTRNHITELTEDGLRPLTSLVYLMGEENRISHVSASAFHTLEDLSYMSLSQNPLTSMDDVLSENTGLSYLDLSQCHLQTVPSGLPWAIRYLQLRQNNITKIMKDTFRHTRFLGIMILDENDMTEIEPGAFMPIVHLQQIWLNGNKLTSFPSPIPSSVDTVSMEKNEVTSIINGDFPENSKLKLLSLKGNKIHTIGPFTFSKLSALQELYLSSNAITELKDKSFAGLRNLTTLEIGRNPITHIDTRFGAGLHALEVLDLSYVEDTEPFVKGNFFRDVPFLKTLSLRYSPSLARHVMTSNETLKSFYNLQELDLRDNQLQTLVTDLPRFFPNLKSIQLARNAWICDVRLLWLHDWMRRDPDIFVDADQVVCALPMHLTQSIIRDLPFHSFFYTTTLPTTTTDLDLAGSGELTTEDKDFTTMESTESVSTPEESLIFTSVGDVSFTEPISVTKNPRESSEAEITEKNFASVSVTGYSDGAINNGGKSALSYTTTTSSATENKEPTVKTPSDGVSHSQRTKPTPQPSTTTASTSSKTSASATAQKASTAHPVSSLSSSSPSSSTSFQTTTTTSPSSSVPRRSSNVSRRSSISTTPTTSSQGPSTSTVVVTEKTTTKLATEKTPRVTSKATFPTTTSTPTPTVKATLTPPTTTTTTTAATTTVSSTTITTTTRRESTTTTTTTTTTIPTTITITTRKKTTTTTTTTQDNRINNTGDRSTKGKGQGSTKRKTISTTTTATTPTSTSESTTTTRRRATTTTATTPPATSTITTPATPTTTTTSTIPPSTTTSTTPSKTPTLPTQGDDTPVTSVKNGSSDLPSYGQTKNRMPSVADAPATTKTIIIATSVTIIALIVILIGTAFVLRHRRQIQLMYQRAFSYTIETSDTAFVLADQDDPDMLTDPVTPIHYRSRSGSGSRSSMDRGSRSSASRNTYVERDDSMDLFMWKEY